MGRWDPCGQRFRLASLPARLLAAIPLAVATAPGWGATAWATDPAARRNVTTSSRARISPPRSGGRRRTASAPHWVGNDVRIRLEFTLRRRSR